MIEKDLDLMFDLQDVDGDVDINGVLAAYERLKYYVTVDDLPRLLEAIQSPGNNFWTRELLSEPIARLGGVDALESLFEAFDANIAEGHDNDGFSVYLIEIAEAESDKCSAECNRLLLQPAFKSRETAQWLLSFTESRAQQGAAPNP